MRRADGGLTFHPAPAPTEADVAWVVKRVHRRLERLGIGERVATETDTDALTDESVALAGLTQAAVLGRAALGRRAGRGPVRLGGDPDAPWREVRVPLHAHLDGFDLHAAVHVRAGDRDRLEQLCGYLCRPPLGRRRLERLRDGRVALVLQRPWADGTTHLVFTPHELLARLVPLVPRPRINLLLYHGVLAPNAPWRRAVVVRAVDSPVERRRPAYRAWADLMRRAFEADVLACPRCGGRMVVLATIGDPAVIRRILTHLGLSLEPGEALPSRAPPKDHESIPEGEG